MPRQCQNCRYWSEMKARVRGGSLDAVCVAPVDPSATQQGQFTNSSQTCAAWRTGILGAIDKPNTDPERYAARDIEILKTFRQAQLAFLSRNPTTKKDPK